MTNCDLCGLAIGKNSVQEHLERFCCYGCQAVFKILQSRGELKNFRETSLFKQAVAHRLISNPQLLEQLNSKPPQDNTLRISLEISEMWCPSCAEVIRWVLLQQKGIVRCLVDYATDLAMVEYSPIIMNKDSIYQTIRALGYQPQPLDTEFKKASSKLYLRFGVASFCAFSTMMFATPLYASYLHHDPLYYGFLFASISFFFTLPVMLFCAWPIFLRALTSLQVGVYGMEALVAIASVTAFGLSSWELWQGGTKVYFDSLSVVIAFILLGKIIEQKAKFSSKESLFKLYRTLPRKGRVLKDSSEVYLPLKEIKVGDKVAVFSGEKIVLDGVICSGEGACDESFISGEALPILKRRGDKVVGGAILQNGSLVVEVTATFEESILQQILGTIQEDIGHKSIYLRAADRVIKWFVPLVLAVALFTGISIWLFESADSNKTIIETAWTRIASILLISCPCALGIAAPLAEAYTIQGLSALGVIVRNRGCLAWLGKETSFVFDKTGTITEGKFYVKSGLEKLSLMEKRYLKALVGSSIHPICNALNKALEEVTPHALEKIIEFPGKGMEGTIGADVYYLGSDSFITEKGIVITKQCKTCAIESTIFFANRQQVIAQIILGDQIKPGVSMLLKSLGALDKVMLSGDAHQVVETIAERCGIKEWHARISPLEKRAYIEGLRKEGKTVCMVGDGINDAPALTAANISVSMASASEISMQVSDLVLTTERLEVIGEARNLAKKGQKIVSQNLFWAFFYNVIGIGLAACGFLTPIFAAAAMILSSLMVMGNALRAKRI